MMVVVMMVVVTVTVAATVSFVSVVRAPDAVVRAYGQQRTGPDM